MPLSTAADYRIHNLLWACATLVFIAVTSVALGYLGRLVARARGLSAGEQRKVFVGVAFAGPWIVGFFIFVLGPSLVSFYYSFTNYKLGEPITTLSLGNYQTLFNSATTQGRQFAGALFNSLYYALIGVPLQIFAALGMALLLNRDLPLIKGFRTIFYLPVLLAGSAAALLAWRYMLGTNGGFVNIALRKLADSFFVFGWLYRGFIYVMETFSALWAGFTRGDPIGPFKYAIPVVITVLTLIYLSRGDWTDGKRANAWRVAQIFIIIFCFGLVIKLLTDAPITGSWVQPGKVALIGKLFTFQTTLEQPENLDYLRKVYASETLSSLWFYLAGGLTLIGVSSVSTIAVIGDGARAQLRRRLVAGALIIFGILALSTIIDGARYFQAFDAYTAATGKPSYHFTLFRQMATTFPEPNRLPLWMTNELWSKPSLVLITMWSSGAGMLIFLAALKGVPKSFYEAAQVDGASRIQQFFKITLPLISPAMFYNLVIGVIAALQTFDTIYILQNTNTIDSLRSAAYFLFTRTFQQGQIGEGAAVSWILAALILTVTALQFRWSRRWVHYEA
ncbi:MAG TPA: ABC transporter permease subunit [Aggregatilineales bacterium]|nr:sugar ABC transporter permease [Anaerolineales bacterium]HRE47622.1 ABC transporter permease subunit [Aggregatilineales bacterium]